MFIGGAAPATVSHTLTVTIVGDGSVTVDGTSYTDPVTVDEGTSLALVATPASGWQFDGWSGDASASPVIMDADKSVTATFSEISTPQYTLTVTVVGDGGSVEVDGNIYTVPVTVDEDTVLELEALADEGWQFDGWTVDASGTNSTTSVTMDADKEVTATFKECGELVLATIVIKWHSQTENNNSTLHYRDNEGVVLVNGFIEGGVEIDSHVGGEVIFTVELDPSYDVSSGPVALTLDTDWVNNTIPNKTNFDLTVKLDGVDFAIVHMDTQNKVTQTEQTQTEQFEVIFMEETRLTNNCEGEVNYTSENIVITIVPQ